MARKSSANHAGIYLYKKDIFASARCRALSREGAGVYFFLLLHLADMPQKGVYRLKDWVAHSNWKKSDYRKCLKIRDKRERLTLFAKWLAKNDLPWDRTEVLPCLQELYDRGIIIIEGDMLIQPRMAKESGFKLPDLDNDGTPEAWTEAIVEAEKDGSSDGDDNGVQNGVQKSTENSRPRVGAGDAPAQSKRVGVRVNNKNSIGSSKGGVGEILREGEKSDDVKTDATPSVKSDTPQDKPAQIPVADCPPTLEQIQAYMQEQGELGRIFRYITAEEYYDEGCKSGWMQRGGRPLYDWKAQLRSFEAYRRNHGDTPVAARGQQPTAPKQGDPVQATPPKDGKYRKW